MIYITSYVFCFGYLDEFGKSRTFSCIGKDTRDLISPFLFYLHRPFERPRRKSHICPHTERTHYYKRGFWMIRRCFFGDGKRDQWLPRPSSPLLLASYNSRLETTCQCLTLGSPHFVAITV